MRKAAFGMVFALLVLSAPFFVLDVQQVNANGSVYIRADGSIEGTDKIVTLDNVTYTLVGNINNSIIVERDSIVVDGAGCTLQGTGSDAGIELPGSNNVTIRNVTITKFGYGIYVFGFSDGNYVGSSYGKIVENKITDNCYGIFLKGSDHNIILGNYIAANEVAAIRLSGSSNNIVVVNNITDNNIGVSSTDGYSNRCHHNSFVNNTIQVEAEADYSSNVWDNDYPSGGNYWSDYNGTDFCSGPYQNESGSDGIGDTPMIINEGNSDRYPLMTPSVYEHTFVLTITTTLGGTTNPEPGTYVYDVITYVSVTAVPLADYVFDHWILDNGNAYGNPIYTILMDNNHTLEAVFVPAPIHIRADGSIDPPDAPVSTIDNVTYTLTASTSHSIIVERDNIVLDGAGHVIQGLGPSSYSGGSGIGIDMQDRNNVTVKNTTVKAFMCGISLRRSNSSILGNNSITSNFYGINLEESSSVLRNNVINDNNYSLVIYCSELSHFINDVDASNTINGKPIIYLVNVQNLVIDPQTYPSIGFLAVVNSTNVTVRNLDVMKNNFQGILFAYTNCSLIQNVTVAENEVGIFLFRSFNNTITRCNMKQNSFIGLWACESSDNSVYHNNFVNNTYRQADLFPWSASWTSPCGPKLSVDIWDDGYPSGGNFWSDYAGVDANGDGIGDTPYTIDVDKSEILLNEWIQFNSSIQEKEYNLTLMEGNKLQFYASFPQGYGIMDFKIVIDGILSMERLNVSHVDEIWVVPINGTYTFHVNSTAGYVQIAVIKWVDIMDKYPLAAPFCSLDVGTWNETSYSIDVVSNSTVSDFCFDANQAQPFISFNVTGESGTMGFCRVAIPKDLLWTETNWTVYVDGQPVNYTLVCDENCTYVCFVYNHSTKTVQIIGTNVIPEYPSSPVLLIFIMATLLATTVCRRKRFGHSLASRRQR